MSNFIGYEVLSVKKPDFSHPVLRVCVCVCVQYRRGVQYRGDVQYRGVFSTLGVDIMMHVGDILSTVRDIMMDVGDILNTVGDIMSTVGDIMMHVGDIISTVGDVQYRGGILLFEYPHDTDTPTVLMISPHVS